MTIDNIKPDIRFRKNGMIDISSRITNILGIQKGDAINIYSEGHETYLFISAKQPAIKSYRGICYPPVKNGRFMRAYWVELARKIITESGAEEAHYRVGEPVERMGKTMLPIITRINLYQND